MTKHAYEIQPGDKMNGKTVAHVSESPVTPTIHVHFTDGSHESYPIEATV